jgi:hypothetical protein
MNSVSQFSGYFDPDCVRLMREAFEDACHALPDSKDASARDRLSKAIIKVAKTGELDRARLRDGALADLQRIG